MFVRDKFFDWKVVDHAKEFTAKDYFAFNDSLGYIRYNPNPQLKVSRAFNMDIYLKAGEGYILYEFLNSSVIRPFADRVLYNPQNGDFKRLLRNNGPIYTCNGNTHLFEGQAGMVDVPRETGRPVPEAFRKYIRFFFDHVSGRNGFFYICENFEEIREAVTIYYNKKANKEEKESQRKKLDTIRDDDRMGKLRDAVEQYLVLPSSNGKFKMTLSRTWDAKKYLCAVNAVLVFKNALFNVTIRVSADDVDRMVSLADESMGFVRPDIYGDGAQAAFDALGYLYELPPFDLF